MGDRGPLPVTCHPSPVTLRLLPRPPGTTYPSRGRVLRDPPIDYSGKGSTRAIDTVRSAARS